MNRWHEDPDELNHSGVFDPLCVQRSAPMDDEEAALIEALCQAATPGPLVVRESSLVSACRTTLGKRHAVRQ